MGVVDPDDLFSVVISGSGRPGTALCTTGDPGEEEEDELDAEARWPDASWRIASSPAAWSWL
jgi:hypothetical protein